MQELNQAVEFITERFSFQHKPKPKVAIVLGSGLGHFANAVKKNSQSASLSFADIPHFAPSTVEGHNGELIFGMIEQKHPVLILSGRLHFYEGFEASQVILPIRVLHLLGITTLILTNASGAIRDDFEPGQLMAIADHLNLTGHSPLVGKNFNELGPRFVDMTEAYDPELIGIAKKAAFKADIKMHEGVYAGLLGPCYETPSEIRMLKILGADAVGMSTVFETIAARHMGLKVLALSCLTNKAAGLSKKKICHDEVIENNAHVANKLGLVLTEIVGQIA